MAQVFRGCTCLGPQRWLTVNSLFRRLHITPQGLRLEHPYGPVQLAASQVSYIEVLPRRLYTAFQIHHRDSRQPPVCLFLTLRGLLVRRALVAAGYSMLSKKPLSLPCGTEAASHQ